MGLLACLGQCFGGPRDDRDDSHHQEVLNHCGGYIMSISSNIRRPVPSMRRHTAICTVLQRQDTDQRRARRASAMIDVHYGVLEPCVPCTACAQLTYIAVCGILLLLLLLLQGSSQVRQKSGRVTSGNWQSVPDDVLQVKIASQLASSGFHCTASDAAQQPAQHHSST